MNGRLTSKRISYIDIARGGAIFLVILGHTYRGNVVQNWLYSFHMPVFFSISGLLCSVNPEMGIKGFFRFLFKKVRVFIVPYVLFLALNYAYWLVVERHFREFDQGPLWFLPALLVIECLAALVLYKSKQYKHGIECTVGVLLALFVGLSFFSRSDSIIVAWILRISNGLIWYCIGYLIKDKNILINIFKKNRWLVVLILFVLSVVLGCLNGRVDMYANRFGNVALYIISGIVGSVFFLTLSMLIDKNKVMEYFGRNSLIIMCTHEPIKRAVIQIASIITHKPSEEIRNNVIIGLCFAIIVCVIEVVVIECFRWMSRLSKNKRMHVLFEYVR